MSTDKPINPLDLKAIKQARKQCPDLCPSWRPFLYVAKDYGLVITGCKTTVFQRGPRKGRTKWLKGQQEIEVLVQHPKPKHPRK